MDIHLFLHNFAHPPVLFFFLGLAAVLFKSDLEIPSQIGKFLSLYLLFHIGFTGGEKLMAAGFSGTLVEVLLACVLISFLTPFIAFRILRIKLDTYNAGAIAATYGSISAVTFATASSFLESLHVHADGFMTAGMALMESPAIIAGLVLIGMSVNKLRQAKSTSELSEGGRPLKEVLHEAFFNGSVFLLLGSMLVGMISGSSGGIELKPFVDDIFQGMLSLYMLDMGLLAGKRIGDLKQSGAFLVAYGLIFPPVMAAIGIGLSYMMHLPQGDALLFTVLCASASYVAVPAAMRTAVPQANMSLLLPMSLCVTFTLNIAAGIPLYFSVIHKVWGA